MTSTDRYPEPEDVVRSDVPLVRNALADVAETVSKPVEAECCDDFKLDRYGYIRVDDIVVGRAMRNRYGRGYVVFVAGERANHVFPGRNAIFRSAEEAAQARAEEVRGL